MKLRQRITSTVPGRASEARDGATVADLEGKDAVKKARRIRNPSSSS